MQIADLHIHSKYSRATSRECDCAHLEVWARRKGVTLLGTGDFTHPAWRRELEESLVEAGEGVFALRDDLRLPGEVEGEARFVLSSEISCIYKKDGRTRKVHHVILMPSFAAARRLSERLEGVGNLRSDGRPILGLDSRDLLQMALEACPEAIFIPAHIWTPHFSMLGAFSGFESVEDCFGDLAGEIYALETGLSSDPPMNWRVPALDGYRLVSNSDAHSPSRLAREATLLEIEPSYAALRRALRTGEGLAGTLEFFPEEGKYHLDGHRNCRQCLEPAQTMALGGICPVCGRKLTVGVKHRVEELAGRPEGYAPPDAKPFESLAPLAEVLGACMGVGADARRVQESYGRLLGALGSELYILREAPLEDIRAAAGEILAEGVRRLREGRVERCAGYDGEYGSVRLFAPGELRTLAGQTAMFDMSMRPREAKKPAALKARAKAAAAVAAGEGAPAGMNQEQAAAARSDAAALAVVAGPGTGKTFTLVERIACLLERGVSPAHVTAVTFTNLAARELRQRLEARVGKRAARSMHVGTFHALCLEFLEERPLLGEEGALEVLRGLPELGKRSPRAALRAISAAKNGVEGEQACADRALVEAYQARVEALGARDLDDVLLDALRAEPPADGRFDHLLVDEFQDINAVQHALVRHWSAVGKTLFVIGDPDQSIYGFRGADAGCFARLRADMPALRSVTLRQNYRSTAQILACALRCIQNNPGAERLLTAARGQGERVRLACADTPFSQAVWIAKEVARMAGGVDMLTAAQTEREARAFSEVAILARTHRQLELIEECLVHDGIPCVVAGREDYLEAGEVRQALAFFHALVRPDDEAGRRAALRLNGCAADAPEADASPEADKFRRALALFEPRLGRGKPCDFVRDWIDLHAPSAALERLEQAAAMYDTLAGMLDALEAGDEADVRRRHGRQRATGAVTLMTLHGAKGLEFPVVFLPDAGVLPRQTPDRPADLEEERRLFFVGLTRAREELILSCVGERSPLAAELGGDLCCEVIPARKRPPRVEQLSMF